MLIKPLCDTFFTGTSQLPKICERKEVLFSLFKCNCVTNMWCPTDKLRNHTTHKL